MCGACSSGRAPAGVVARTPLTPHIERQVCRTLATVMSQERPKFDERREDGHDERREDGKRWKSRAQQLVPAGSVQSRRVFSAEEQRVLAEQHTIVQLERPAMPTLKGLYTRAYCLLLRHEYDQVYGGDHGQEDPEGIIGDLIKQPCHMWQDRRITDHRDAVQALQARITVRTDTAASEKAEPDAGGLSVRKWRDVYELVQPCSAFMTKVRQATDLVTRKGSATTLRDLLQTPSFAAGLNEQEKWFVTTCLEKRSEPPERMMSAVNSSRTDHVRKVMDVMDKLQELQTPDGPKYVFTLISASGTPQEYDPTAGRFGVGRARDVGATATSDQHQSGSGGWDAGGRHAAGPLQTRNVVLHGREDAGLLDTLRYLERLVKNLDSSWTAATLGTQHAVTTMDLLYTLVPASKKLLGQLYEVRAQQTAVIFLRIACIRLACLQEFAAHVHRGYFPIFQMQPALDMGQVPAACWLANKPADGSRAEGKMASDDSAQAGEGGIIAPAAPFAFSSKVGPDSRTEWRNTLRSSLKRHGQTAANVFELDENGDLPDGQRKSLTKVTREQAHQLAIKWPSYLGVLDLTNKAAGLPCPMRGFLQECGAMADTEREGMKLEVTDSADEQGKEADAATEREVMDLEVTNPADDIFGEKGSNSPAPQTRSEWPPARSGKEAEEALKTAREELARIVEAFKIPLPVAINAYVTPPGREHADNIHCKGRMFALVSVSAGLPGATLQPLLGVWGGKTSCWCAHLPDVVPRVPL